MPADVFCGPDEAIDLLNYESLLDCLAGVPDPRRRHGVRHRAAVVLAFAVAAVMAGADSVTAIAEWAGDAPAEVLEALGARRDRQGPLAPPSLSAFRRVLRKLGEQALAAAFRAWPTAQVLAGLADAGALVIALDGKAVRGARSGDKKAPHLLAAMITGARAVIAQKDADAKTNEITQVGPLLDDIDITGALVTADAPSRSCPHRTASSRTPPRRSSSNAPSATPATARCALPSPPSASPAGPWRAAGHRTPWPAPPAATGRLRPCTTSATSP